MTPTEKRVKIAEACGWVRDEVCDNWKNPSEGPYAIAFMNGSYHYRQLPNYFEDLNACHTFEQTLSPEMSLVYFDCLESICQRELLGKNWLKFAVVTATAAQRAEAFGLTLGLWKEERE